MSASVLYMSMSVDGYIAAPNDGPDNPAATTSCGCTSGTGSVRTVGRGGSIRSRCCSVFAERLRG
jgi:hypothetical protein